MKDIYDERHFLGGNDWQLHRVKPRRKFEETHVSLHIEGWAAAAVAVAAVGASAYSAYSSSKSQKDALNYQKDNAPQFHSYDPVLATYNPNAGVQGYTQAAQNYGGAAQQAAGQLNKYYQQSLEATAPGLKRSVVLAQRNANRDLRGEINPDVAQNIQRASAQTALTGGFGADSGQGRNLSARDFGLTSMQLQQQGAGEAGRNAVLAASLNPVSAASILGTAQDYTARYDQYNVLNSGRQNQAAQDAAGVQNANSQAQYQAGLAGVQAAGISPVGNSVASGVGTLASLYGAYSGGAGGSGGANYYGVGNTGYNTNGYYATPSAANAAYGQGANLGYTPGVGGGYYNTGYG